MNIDEIHAYLRAPASRPDNPTSETVTNELARLKADAVRRDDEEDAKNLWCLEQVHCAHDNYLKAFEELKGEHFYTAWCTFERAELALGFLRPHAGDMWHHFNLGFIESYIQKWQSLFPYRMFLSPELLEIEKVCTICERRISLRNPCGHRVGQIYRGEMCCRRITNLQVLGIALVTKPVQKYSVVFIPNPENRDPQDHYNYALVEYATRALRSPFDRWDVEWTKRQQPHSRFRNINPNDPCPCESTLLYKDCCLKEAGVWRPHVEFVFQDLPANEIPQEVYVGQ